ncbi:MAG TPA: SDR family NAD(P)-dependent oxidoreductase [Anaerolineae bacterium]|jgi:3-oxoacyl-[acyl-carrier protein] reductase|nr:SDR family NAD(P)-dependent oxidoreductase [Anaerolineae bacterium]
MSFAGRTALVTGAGSGIGAAIATHLAARGANVVVNDIDPAAAERTAAAIAAASGIAVAFAADVTSEPEVRAMCRRILETFGALDILVNNAGVLSTTPTAELAVDAWERTLAVNLTGAFNCCRAVLPAMQQRRYGKIINIASLAGESGGISVGVDYAASKGGLLALTRRLALEVAAFAINVNAIAPGTTSTPMVDAMPEEDRTALLAKIPLGRFATPADIAYATCFLAGDESSFITGATLDVNGGLLMR